MAHQSNENQAHKRSFDAAFLNSDRSSGEVRIPITKSLIPGFLPYFEGYGEIESMSVSIRFKDKIVADSVLRKRFHKIGNKIWMAERPKESSKASNAKKIKLDQPSSAHILDLNDDTLMKIFKHLNFIDLAHASATCTRLDSVAKQLFVLKHNTLRLDITEYNTLDLNRLSFNDADVVLPRFGDSVKRLTMNGYHGHQNRLIFKDRLDTVTKYCRDMESFWLRNSYFGMMLEKVLSSFSKLKHLHLEMGSFESDGDIHDLPVVPNPNVEKLTIDNCSNSPNFFAITTLMPNLQELSFCDIDFLCKLTKSNMKQLGQLKALKHLTFSCGEVALVTLFDGLSSGGVMIENINIFVDTIAEPIDDVISAMTKLKTLKAILLNPIDHILQDHHLVQIGKGLPLLSEIEIEPINMTSAGLKETLRFANRLTKMILRSSEDSELALLSMADYQAIVNTVKRRPEKLKLLLYLPQNICLDQIGADIRERNSKWLEIHP